MDEQLLAGGWTRAKLTSLSPEQRHSVWKNARTKGTPEALELMRAIEQLGLPYSDPAALTMDEPITIKMHEIINSAKGRGACLAATAEGLPAIAGVDPMLSDALGVDYQSGNLATATAGSLVADLMRQLGYESNSKRALPAACVAKTGAYWTPRKSKT